jgi:hypothetical protein
MSITGNDGIININDADLHLTSTGSHIVFSDGTLMNTAPPNSDSGNTAYFSNGINAFIITETTANTGFAGNLNPQHAISVAGVTVIDKDGSMGIATTSPSANLHVVGNVVVGSQLTIAEYATDSIAIGRTAGLLSQNNQAVAIGQYCGVSQQGLRSVAVGPYAGQQQQDNDSVSIGYRAGQQQQGLDAVAVGRDAGVSNQATRTVAIGAYAGQSGQNTQCVSIGYQAGQTGQRRDAVAICSGAGQSQQGSYAVAIGLDAGQLSQNNQAVAIGQYCGVSQQGLRSVAVGPYAGQQQQANDATSIGYQAGRVGQGSDAVAIGREAARSNQDIRTVAIGAYAGGFGQNTHCVSIGYQAGRSGQHQDAIAIGVSAGNIGQGSHAVAIGAYAAQSSQHSSTIMLNASGVNQPTNSTNGFYVTPIRPTNSTYVLEYNTTTKEVTYTTGGSSDDRLKHNEVEVSNVLSSIDQLRFLTYDKTYEMLDADFNGDLGDLEHYKDAGFIAQEVAEIPEFSWLVKGGGSYEELVRNPVTEEVIDEETGEVTVTEIAPGEYETIEIPYSINYRCLANYSIQGVKELHALVKAQQEHITTLTARIEALENN